MITETDLYLTPVELYRLGNATSPRLDNVRIPRDMPVRDINGILHVMPGSKGVSLLDALGLSKTRSDGWVWKIKKGTFLPPTLRLVHDHDGHYLLTPSRMMPLDEFRVELTRLAVHAERVMKLTYT